MCKLVLNLYLRITQTKEMRYGKWPNFRGDVTTMTTIPLDHRSKGIIHVKGDGIIAVLPLAAVVFAEVDAKLCFETKVAEGTSVKKGDIR